jgi:hypothetical protein
MIQGGEGDAIKMGLTELDTVSLKCVTLDSGLIVIPEFGAVQCSVV